MTPRLNPVKYAIEVVERDDGEKDFRVWMDARDGRGPINRPIINIVGQPDRARYGFYLNFLAEDSVAECLGSEWEPLPIDVLLAARTERGVALISVRERNGQTRIKSPAQLFNIDPATVIEPHRATTQRAFS